MNLFPVNPENIPSIGLIVANARIDFRAPAQLGDTLIVYIRIPDFGTKSFPMEYRIENAKTRLLIAEGSTLQVMYDYGRRVTIPVPDDVKKRIVQFESAD